MRPNMSEGPPAANGTYIVIGRFGQACARAPLAAMTAAALVALRIVLRFITPPALGIHLKGWQAIRERAFRRPQRDCPFWTWACRGTKLAEQKEFSR
jgi:hypothetical protein